MLMIEKALFLKSLAVFAGIPDDALLLVTAALQELEFPPGHTIFEKGDMGTSMYLVAEGCVSIHDGERVLATLCERKAFGELAALDTQPRSASATTLTECRLFRLDQETLYELISDRVEVAKSIISFLCSNLRSWSS